MQRVYNVVKLSNVLSFFILFSKAKEQGNRSLTFCSGLLHEECFVTKKLGTVTIPDSGSEIAYSLFLGTQLELVFVGVSDLQVDLLFRSCRTEEGILA